MFVESLSGLPTASSARTPKAAAMISVVDSGETMPKRSSHMFHSSDYPVASFGGSKELILSTSTWLGGKNYSLGIIYLGTGALYCILAILFMVRQTMKPRYGGSGLCMPEFTASVAITRVMSRRVVYV
jgi:hypothetical protein